MRFFMETWIWLAGLIVWAGALTRNAALITAFDMLVYVLNYYTILKFALLILGWTLSLIIDPISNMDEYGLYNYWSEQNSIGDLMPLDWYRDEDIAEDWPTTTVTLTLKLCWLEAWEAKHFRSTGFWLPSHDHLEWCLGNPSHGQE